MKVLVVGGGGREHALLWKLQRDDPALELLAAPGNPGMATGGSGDVLTGTIAGLLAQLKNPESATKLGVYLHGFAGDLAFEERGNGLVAGDIAANLGRALVEIPKREVERINGRLRRLM